MDDGQSIPESRRRNMQAIRGKDTKPELVVRRLLHGMGYRYRLHDRRLPGTPDLVFPSRKAVVEVRGCFWHRHGDPGCPNSKLPATRREWWEAKLEGNVARDARNVAALEALGWRVLVLWECRIHRSARTEARAAARFLGPSGRKR